jgi:hypothetical protein
MRYSTAGASGVHVLFSLLNYQLILYTESLVSIFELEINANKQTFLIW